MNKIYSIIKGKTNSEIDLHIECNGIKIILYDEMDIA